MAEYFTNALVLHLIIFQAVVLLVILSNAWLLHRARRHAPPLVFPKVSLLVPARNEAGNIAVCIQSLLNQDSMPRPGKLFDPDGEDGGPVLVRFDLFGNPNKHQRNASPGDAHARGLSPQADADAPRPSGQGSELSCSLQPSPCLFYETTLHFPSPMMGRAAPPHKRLP